jgi:hypothetical protein
VENKSISSEVTSVEEKIPDSVDQIENVQ